MKKLKVGIIGLGFGVTSHLPAFKSNKKCEVIALCSKNLKKGEIFKKKNNIKHYFSNWKRMLNEIELDLVSIAVPPNEQFNIICECLKKSIPVFAEKPLATNITKIRKIFNLQKKLNIEVMPEIELPAHSWATIQVFPELHDKMTNSRFQDIANYENNTINPSLKATWDFLETMLKMVTLSSFFQMEGLSLKVGLREDQEVEFGSFITKKVVR
mgnify:CR=1 FL=1